MLGSVQVHRGQEKAWRMPVGARAGMQAVSQGCAPLAFGKIWHSVNHLPERPGQVLATRRARGIAQQRATRDRDRGEVGRIESW